MEIGYIGLGKMGFNMVQRLLEKKHTVVAFDQNKEAVGQITAQGAKPADSLKKLTESLASPKLIWVMVPYRAVDTVLAELVPLLSTGDTVIDGGNSPYKETLRRAAELEQKGINFLDAGTSGGPGGARTGACIMVGGKEDVFRKFELLFRDLAVDKGYAHVGASGAGHFVKMVHNGIEYGMMEALAEGFAIIKASSFRLDLVKIAGLFNHGSVIESQLVGWLGKAFEQYGPELNGISGAVAQSGEGMWTVDAAKELGVPASIIKGALDYRLESQKSPSYSGQIVSALRHEFGGHEVQETAKRKS